MASPKPSSHNSVIISQWLVLAHCQHRVLSKPTVTSRSALDVGASRTAQGGSLDEILSCAATSSTKKKRVPISLCSVRARTWLSVSSNRDVIIHRVDRQLQDPRFCLSHHRAHELRPYIEWSDGLPVQALAATRIGRRRITWRRSWRWWMTSTTTWRQRDVWGMRSTIPRGAGPCRIFLSSTQSIKAPLYVTRVAREASSRSRIHGMRATRSGSG